MKNFSTYLLLVGALLFGTPVWAVIDTLTITPTPCFTSSSYSKDDVEKSFNVKDTTFTYVATCYNKNKEKMYSAKQYVQMRGYDATKATAYIQSSIMGVNKVILYCKDSIAPSVLFDGINKGFSDTTSTKVQFTDTAGKAIDTVAIVYTATCAAGAAEVKIANLNPKKVCGMYKIEVIYNTELKPAAFKLDSITVADYTTEFQQYKDFVFDGKATAYYSNKSTKDVSADVVKTGYDMTKAGPQTVTVSYTEKDTTVTAKYAITVVARDTLKLVPTTQLEDSCWYVITAEKKGFNGFLPAAAYTETPKAQLFRTAVVDSADMWQLVKVDTTWQLKTANGEGLYMLNNSDNKGVRAKADTAANFTITPSKTSGCFNLKAPTDTLERYLCFYSYQQSLEWRSFVTPSSNASNDICFYRIRKNGEVLMPQISPKEPYFVDTAIITLTAEQGTSIYYTLDGSEPTSASTLYNKPFIITTNTSVKAIAMLGSVASPVLSATYIKRTLDSITISGYVDTLKQYDEYKFGGKVTALYNNSDKVAVTKLAKFSGYDMDKAGKQTVTVSYTEGDITKTAQYSLFVEEKQVLSLVPITSFDVANQTWFVITATVNDSMYYLPGATKDRATTPAKLCDFNRLEKTDMWQFNKVDKGWKIVDAEGRGLYYAATGTDVGCKADTASFFTIEQGSDCRYVNMRSENTGGERVLGVLANKNWRAYQKTPENASIDIRLYKIMVPGEVLRPVILPGDGKFSEPVKVQIYSEEKGMTIYYTLDGSNPTTASTVYTSEFEIKETTTVKAIAVKGASMSLVTTAVYEYEPISGIEAVKNAEDKSKTTMKFIENGRVIILRDGIKYTLLGEKM